MIKLIAFCLFDSAKLIGVFLLETLFVALVSVPLIHWLGAPWYASFSIVAIVAMLSNVANDLDKIRKNLEPKVWYARNK